MNWSEYLIQAAQHSKGSAEHWFRYLRKVIFEETSYLQDEDVTQLLASDALTDFQKESLEEALRTGSQTHARVVSLNRPAQLTNVRHLMERYKHG